MGDPFDDPCLFRGTFIFMFGGARGVIILNSTQTMARFFEGKYQKDFTMELH